MIQFNCPSCGHAYQVGDDKAGAKARCKNCGSAIEVPRSAAVTSFDLETLPALNESSKAEENARPFQDVRVSGDEAVAYDVAAPSPSASGQYKPRYRRRGVDPLLEGRPYDGAGEVEARRRHITVLGIVLIVGFLMPTCVPTGMGGTTLTFPNITGLGSDLLGVTAKLWLLYPLLAGIAAIVLAVTTLPPKRGVVLLAAGLIPIIVSFADSDILASLQGEMMGAAMTQAGVMSLLLLLGSLGVYVGSRVRWYRPTLTYSYYIGMAGGIALILFCFVPMHGTMVVAVPFQAMKDSVIGGLGMLIAVGLLLTAAIVSLVNTPNQNPSGASNFANIAFRSLLGSWVILPATVIIAVGVQMMGMGGGFQFLFMAASGMLKGALWIGGVMLLTPMAGVDIMLGQPITDPHACVSCGYDLRGSHDRVCPECGHENM